MGREQGTSNSSRKRQRKQSTEKEKFTCTTQSASLPCSIGGGRDFGEAEQEEKQEEGKVQSERNVAGREVLNGFWTKQESLILVTYVEHWEEIEVRPTRFNST
ncbi:hypothetical protein NX059_011522 [Plenodomus lindquistii]|nr:hypothetical protein NX059_011522 [Plenodomus lindquistii]